MEQIVFKVFPTQTKEEHNELLRFIDYFDGHCTLTSGGDYSMIDVDDDDLAAYLVRNILTMGGVEAAYIKPKDELP